MSERYYLLKIELLEIEPPIWRRFMVPGSITLDRLHDVIQIVMGWQDSHLHEFAIGKKRYTEYSDDGLPCARYRFVDLIKQKGRTFSYLYDFGDFWQHELTIEDSRYFNPDLPGPVFCLEGERGCPPEDVGGVTGYFDFCQAMKDPAHEEHESFMEWCGGSFDSEQFEADYVNWELCKYLRWSRDRLMSWGLQEGTE